MTQPKLKTLHKLLVEFAKELDTGPALAAELLFFVAEWVKRFINESEKGRT